MGKGTRSRDSRRRLGSALALYGAPPPAKRGAGLPIGAPNLPSRHRPHPPLGPASLVLRAPPQMAAAGT
eukprot:8791745-Pyramimonas_sp.AAC.1